MEQGLKTAYERIAQEAQVKTGTLDLSGLGLEEIPAELFELTHLTVLNLGYRWQGQRNEILEIPSKISKLKYLIDLDLSHNRIETLDALKGLTALQTLNCYDTQVSDLSPVQGLTALQTLNCDRTQVSDLSPVQGLTALQTLNCDSTQVSDLSPVQGLTALQTLNCSDTQVSDLSPVQGLTALQTLNCDSTQVSDLSPVQGLTALQTLNCSDTQVSDLSPVQGLTALQTLNCSDTQVSDLSPVQGLTALQSLSCDRTQVSDLSLVQGLTALQTLNCDSTQVSDLSPIQGLTALQTLNCSDTQVSDLSPVQGLTALQGLSCDRTQVSDLSPVQGLTALQTLRCDRTQVSDLSPVQGLTALQSLYCSSTQVSDLSPVQGLTALQSLSCGGTQVSDLSPVQGLTALQSLYCYATQVSDLSPVQGLTALQSLYCSSTQVSDLSPVQGLTALQSLSCGGTQVSDLSPIQGLTALQRLSCDSTQVSDLSPLKETLRSQLTTLYIFGCPVRDVPPEILSDNCARALKAHFEDLGDDPICLNQFKILILGNGRVGKTQIARALQGKDMIKGDVSTHAISTISHDIFNDPKLPKARIWDFGGQDIYHGTHALFMRGRAATILGWNLQSENTFFHDHDGQRFANEKLPYWVEFIRRLSGHNNPLILTQTRCEADGELKPPIKAELLEPFDFHQKVSFDAETKTGLDDLLGYLEIAQRKIPRPLIGPGRLAVKEAIEKIKADEPDRKFLRFTEFEAMCKETGGVSNPGLFADYLHHADVVFYRKGLFGDKLVLDTNWMLDAIYAVLTRDVCKVEIERSQGRFTLADLGRWLWDADHNHGEQAQLLDMMRATGICFQISPDYYRHSEKTKEEQRNIMYIAPELLPPEKPALDGRWDDTAETVKFDIEFDFLPDPVFRAVMSRLGAKAGLNGLYWKTGLYLFENKYRSAGVISLSKDEDEDAFAGTILVQTQNNDAQRFCDDLVDLIYETAQDYGFTPKTAKPDRGKDGALKSRKAMAEDVLPDGQAEPHEDRDLSFGQKSNFSGEIFVSYSWANKDHPDHEKDVDRLCEEAEARGIKIWRDKDDLGIGQSIDVFMNDLAQSRRCFVFLSEKYLRSEFCMYELYHLWQWSRSHSAQFHDRVRIFNIDAQIFSIPDRLKIARHWKTQFDEYKSYGKEDFEVMAPDTFGLIKKVQAFAMHTDEILSHIARTVQPNDFNDFLEHGFGDL